MKTPRNFIYILITVVTTIQSALCQPTKLDNNITIAGFHKAVFYSNEINLLGVSSTNDSIQSLVIKSSQGDLQNVDSGITNGFLRLNNLKDGKVTISVFSKTVTGLHLLNFKNFSVITKPMTRDEVKIQKLTIKPELNLEGFMSGNITLISIKDAAKFHINKPYKIKSIIVYVGSYTGFCSQPMITNLSSENFSEDFKQIWKRLQVGNYVQLEQINIIDDKGNAYRMNPISFRITQK